MLDYNGFQVVQASMPGMCAIRLPGKGGSLPEALQGLYTSAVVAQRDIDTYLGNKVGTKKNDTESVSS
jgi:hypothetical protein